MRQTAEILENSANNYLTAKLDLESPLTQTRLAFVEEQVCGEYVHSLVSDTDDSSTRSLWY